MKTVYLIENYSNVKLALIISAPILLFIVMLVVGFKKNYDFTESIELQKTDNESNRMIHIKNIVFSLIVFICWSVSSYPMAISNYNSIHGAYLKYMNKNDYTVSGRVSNYKTPGVDDDDLPEHFKVHDVYFSYSASDRFGYHTLKSDGGYIKGNGQQVRITYYHDKDLNRNIILKLETAENKSAQ